MNRLYVDGQAHPSLCGQTCKLCGRVTFPPNPYGCEQCGAPRSLLEECILSGEGRLEAFATTFHSNRKDRVVPYTVASIRLADGPVIRALMVQQTDEGLSVGQAVHTVMTLFEPGQIQTEPQIRFATHGPN